MPHTVAEAAEVIGKSKAAIFRAIRKGTISATRDESSGMFLIDPAELHRAFPHGPAVSPDTSLDTAIGTPRVADLEGRLADAHETIRDLRARLDAADRRLDTAAAQLGEALAQNRLLADQRAVPVRRWLRWGRKKFPIR